MPYLPATFLERPNRFVARVRLEDGTEVPVHVASSGRMVEILVPGAPALVELKPAAPEAGRKTAGRLVMVQTGRTWVSVDTSLPGKLFRKAVAAGTCSPFAGYTTVRPEYTYGQSRIDFLLTAPDRPPCLVEVKSVTSVLTDPDGVRVARFPDAPTERGPSTCVNWPGPCGRVTARRSASSFSGMMPRRSAPTTPSTRPSGRACGRPPRWAWRSAPLRATSHRTGSGWAD